MNTIGGYSCECPPGEMMMNSRCVDMRQKECFKDQQDLTNIESSTPGSSCNESLSSRPITRVECCCSKGTAYGHPDMCNLCPIPLTDEYYALCGIVEPTKPTGPGGGGTPFPPGGTPGMVPITDVDECSFVKDPCGMGVCMNTYGSYRCDCEEGFAVQNGDPMCKDKNECLVNPCVGGQCKNTFGSFMCTCSAGYIVDETGLRCVDHNECHLNNTCVNGICVNVVGDYRCLCGSGYQPSRGGKACS
ncbi:fibrillin-1 isoform X1, partial [Paramuricea clavata]